MADELETVADIRKDAEARFREMVEAWMQRRTTFRTTLGAMQSFNMMFDRLEAAHKRELSKAASKNGVDLGQLGDCAKLREAVEYLRDASRTFYHQILNSKYNDILDEYKCKKRGLSALLDLKAAVVGANFALAAPPRNCDRFGGDNAKLQKVYYSECGKEYEPQDPNSRQAYLVGYGNWLLALAQKGGAK